MNDLIPKHSRDKKYFRLFPDVVHCKGAVSSALYILSSGRVFWLDPVITQVLSLLELNTPIVEVISKSQASPTDIEAFINFLVNAGAGTFYLLPPYVEKVRRTDLTEDLSWSKLPPKLNLLHIALSNTCRMDCVFCNPDIPTQRFHPCLGCWRGHSSSDLYLSTEYALKAMRECSELDCHDLRLHLGSTQHLNKRLLALLSEGTELGFKSIELITGCALGMTLLDGVVQYEATPVFQLFGADPNTHDKICRVAGSFSAIKENIKILRSMGRSFAIIYLNHEQNADPYKTLKALSTLKPKQLYVDRIDTDNHCARFLYGSEALVPPSLERYVAMLAHRSCKSGRIFLNWDGKYYLCPALSQRPLGDVYLTTVVDLFRNKTLTEYWSDQIEDEVCKGCELRYACRVCEAQRKPIDMCGYNPSSGYWIEKDDYGIGTDHK
jgi:radical SAM protein with 4Fe4S-binding SPASM domain